MTRVIIVHGYTGYPEKNWFPWLKAELEKLGVNVLVPSMPNTNNPQLSEWLPALTKAVGHPDADTYLVGHSLGCPTILRYLESLDGQQTVGGVLLVAGFAEPLPHLPELDNFTEEPWKDDAALSHAKKIIMFSSDDDQAVPFANAERLRDRIGAELITIHGAGHVNEKSGYLQVPFVLEKINEMINS